MVSHQWVYLDIRPIGFVRTRWLFSHWTSLVFLIRLWPFNLACIWSENFFSNFKRYNLELINTAAGAAGLAWVILGVSAVLAIIGLCTLLNRHLKQRRCKYKTNENCWLYNIIYFLLIPMIFEWKIFWSQNGYFESKKWLCFSMLAWNFVEIVFCSEFTRHNFNFWLKIWTKWLCSKK